MGTSINPIRPTQSVISWFIVNREGVIVGSAGCSDNRRADVGSALRRNLMITRETEAEHLGWRTVLGRVLAKTSVFFMVMAAIDIVATYSQPPARFQRLVDIGFTIAFALQGQSGSRADTGAYRSARRRRTDRLPAWNATAIIRVLVSVTLFALAIVVILDNLGVNVTALVAGLGIGGIAIGLAAQGIFSDLFAALAILFDKPFRRGDIVRYGTTTGTSSALASRLRDFADWRRTGDHGQYEAARAGASQRH
jgi:hypothetical protein